MPIIANRSLRTKLVAAFWLVSIFPVALLTIWVEESAVQQEFDTVTEKHLIIAHNLSAAMERYVSDIGAAMESAASSSNPSAKHWRPLFGKLDIHDLMEISTGRQRYLWSSASPATRQQIPDDTLRKLHQDGAAHVGSTQFSDLLRFRDTPVFFVSHPLPNGGWLVGILQTHYLAKLQKSIAFGELGHSMMVDAKGRVIAHPNPKWQQISKDASKLPVVQKMMRGETGVTEFYSPPMKADMIAGHTAVAGVGWGVMVPQPVQELYQRASEVNFLALVISALGIGLAAIFGWWLAKRIAQPLEKINDNILAVQTDGLYVTANVLPSSASKEARQLANSFNDMIVRLRLSHAETVESMRAAKHANQAKSEFLANMSHELRTPLHGIIGFAEISRDEAMSATPEDIERYSGHILTSAENLLALVEAVLDLSKLESGHQHFDLARVEPQTLVTQVRSELQQLAHARDISIAYERKTDALILADAKRIKQVFRNLIANAIKFSPEHSTIHIAISQNDDATVQFEVTDSGPGIPEEELA
jgi:signal transduction histidine kinase